MSSAQWRDRNARVCGLKTSTVTHTNEYQVGAPSSPAPAFFLTCPSTKSIGQTQPTTNRSKTPTNPSANRYPTNTATDHQPCFAPTNRMTLSLYYSLSLCFELPPPPTPPTPGIPSQYQTHLFPDRPNPPAKKKVNIFRLVAVLIFAQQPSTQCCTTSPSTTLR